MASIKHELSELKKELKYGLHVMVRPFDGFWDLKHEKRGSLRASVIFAVLVVIVALLRWQFSGFFFVAGWQRANVNIIQEASVVFFPFILWVVSSWCFTTLMDGEGSMKDIAIATGYALVPIVLISLPLIPVTRLVTAEEGAFISLLINIGFLWAGFLLFASVIVVHQYTIPKAILAIILSVIGMAVILFVAFLIFVLLQQVLMFFISLYNEMTLRWL